MNEPRGNGRHSIDENRRMQHEQGMQERRFHDEDRNRSGSDRDDDRGMEDRGERMGQGYRGDRTLRESERYGQSDRGYGQGQSGYMAGRYGEDRSIGSMGRNQGYSDQDQYSPRMGQRGGGDETGGGWYGGGGGGMSGGRMGGGWGSGQDDRWQGRGGQDYWRDQGGQQLGGGGPMGNQYGSSEHGFQPAGGYYGGAQRSQYGGRDAFGGGVGGEPYGSLQRGYGGYGEGYSGSKQSHRGKGPKNFQRSDERIREIICEALSDDEHIDANDIEVEVKSGEVVLRGTVEDRRTKRMAEDLAERVSGCDVQNQLRVGSATGGNRWQVTSRSNQAQGKEVGTPESDKKHRA